MRKTHTEMGCGNSALVRRDCRGRWRLVLLQRLVVRLEAGHNAEVGLTIWAVVLRLTTEDATVRIRRVPTVVTAQCGAVPSLGAVPKLFNRQTRDYRQCACVMRGLWRRMMRMLIRIFLRVWGWNGRRPGDSSGGRVGAVIVSVSKGRGLGWFRPETGVK